MPETLSQISEIVCGAECPVKRAAMILDGKWTLLIIRDLLSGKKRYSQLQRSLSGISPRILALRLRELESQDLVKRHVYPTNVIEALATFGSLIQP